MKKKFKDVDKVAEKVFKPDAKFALKETTAGIKISYRRITCEKKTVKGLVDAIVLNDDIEISRDHNRYQIRRIRFGSSLIIEPEASNAISIPDGSVAKEIGDVLSQRN